MDKYNISKWTKVRLNDLESSSNRGSLPSTPGVYVIFYKTKEKRIIRLGSEDKQKIFYIGQTKNIRKRLYDFYKDIFLLKKGSYDGYHIAGCTLKYWYNITPFKEIFSDLGSFCVKYYPFRKSHNPKHEENILIQQYFLRFADLPPLNHSFPIRYEKRTLKKSQILFAKAGLVYP
jgi:hypothetical protein